MVDDELLTVERLYPRAAAYICNGVGPGFLARPFPWLFRRFNLLWFNRVLDRPARGHDLRCWRGGRLIEKCAADQEFGAACLRVAAEHRGWRRLALGLTSWLYLKLVKSWAGCLAFHWAWTPRGAAELAALESGLAE